MKSNGYITIVIIAGLSLIGYLFAISPDNAPTQLPLILAGIGALVAVLNKQGDTDSKLNKSIAVSEENAHSIAAVSQQTNHGLEGVNQKVDGHLSGMREEQRASNVLIATLIKQVASLEQDKAVKQSETAHQETSADKAIAAMPAAIAAALATAPATEVVPPTDSAPSRPGEHL